MNIVLLQTRLSEQEIAKLIIEFPQYLFIAPTEARFKELGDDEWSRVEIFYGSRMTREDLERAHQLKWIHSPSPILNALCLNDLEKIGNVHLTCNKEENNVQIGEYVMGGILAFAKNLFHWEAADKNPVILWDSKWRDSMWTLGDRTLLQIGLGSVGTEIARLGKEMRMRVWGVQEHRSYHPYCKKVFSYEEMRAAIGSADVVSIALPRGMQKDRILGREEFEMMKQDSILAVIGSKGVIDEEGLAEVAQETKKFRGIILDVFYQVPVSPHSKLWSIPNMIITPEVAPRPKSKEAEAFRLFRYNLRQYLFGNFTDMKNLIGTKQIVTT